MFYLSSTEISFFTGEGDDFWEGLGSSAFSNFSVDFLFESPEACVSLILTDSCDRLLSSDISISGLLILRRFHRVGLLSACTLVELADLVNVCVLTGLDAIWTLLAETDVTWGSVEVGDSLSSRETDLLPWAEPLDSVKKENRLEISETKKNFDLSTSTSTVCTPCSKEIMTSKGSTRNGSFN